MSSYSKVAQRYVKSLLGLAVEQGALEQVHQDMLLFTRTCENSRPFVMMLRSPIVRHEKKREVLHALFENKVNKLTFSIIDIITRKNREPLLPSIASEFHNAYNEYKGIGKASVTTAAALDDKLRNEIISIVKKLSNKSQIELDQKVDENLIGGFVLNVGDRQIDASVKSKLKSLKVKFAENPNVKEI